jgi:hypothetical protein
MGNGGILATAKQNENRIQLGTLCIIFLEFFVKLLKNRLKIYCGFV